MAGKNVLIAFGTRYGSAGIVASDVAGHLEKDGHKVTVVDLKKQSAPAKLGDFDLVVAGSSIAMFMWLGAVKRFMRKCARSGVPAGVYITCGMGINEPEKARERFLNKGLQKTGLEPVLTGIIEPIIDFRPGEGVPEKLKGRISGTIKGMAKDDFQPDGLMDFRKSDRFDAFVKSVADYLKD